MQVGNGLTWGHDLRGSEVVMTYNGPSAMDMIALGPALNTNGKPRARRGSATDPQSVYARVSSYWSPVKYYSWLLGGSTETD